MSWYFGFERNPLQQSPDGARNRRNRFAIVVRQVAEVRGEGGGGRALVEAARADGRASRALRDPQLHRRQHRHRPAGHGLESRLHSPGGRYVAQCIHQVAND